MKNNQKLISITREDLPPGYQAVQSSHALIDFILAYPQIAQKWHSESNYLIQVSVKNEEELRLLKDKIHSKGLKYIAFYEPDLENQLTAIAIEPCELSKKMISNYPLL